MVIKKKDDFDHTKHQDVKWLKLGIIVAACMLPLVFLFSMFAGYKFAENAKTETTTGLTAHTIRQIDSIGDSSDNIMAIQVVRVDLPKNIRSVRYMYIKDSTLKKLYNVWIEARLSPDYAVFSADTPDNNRLVKLMNHEIVCTPYAETMSYRVSPETGRFVSTMCAIGVPPSYGKFSGIIGIMLQRPPSENEVSVIETYLKQISMEVYEDTLQ